MKRKLIISLALISAAILGLTNCSKLKADTKSVIAKPSTTAVKEEQDLTLSAKGYFYSQDVNVEIKSSKSGKIYYTLDGTEPDKKQALYTEPIKLIANNDTKANVIKAKAYYDDGTESAVIVHTYLVGKNVNNRFDTLIFSITTDPYNLYDYEHGIFVEGKLRDDYIAQNPGAVINPDAPANFNIRGMDGEREVYLEVLEPNGTKVIGQNVGIRNYGGWSRAREQKSIKIIARKEYDTANSRLNYAFFPERTSISGNVLDSYKELVLRNCGNDNGFAFIRDELFQTLAGQAGYQDHEAVRPAAMFVNGEYRGFFWLHEVYGDQFFEDHYGKYKGSFEILEGGENFKKINADGDNQKYIQDYEKMYQTYSNLDLTKEKNYKKLTKLLDVENYLSYYAYNIYLGNEDWPHNNYKTYRYYAAAGEEYREAPFDGKWRFLLHDMDFSTGIYGTYANVDNIGNYIGENGEIMYACPLFGQLMQRKDCREIFIKKTLDLLNGALAPKNLSSVLDQMNASRLNELEHTFGKDLLEDWVSFDQLPMRLKVLKDYATQRADHILTEYQEYFKMGGIYTLNVKPALGCKLTINSFTTDKQFSGSYYSNYNTIIKAVIPKGKTFDYWLVNNKKVKSELLNLTSKQIKGDKIDVKMVLK